MGPCSFRSAAFPPAFAFAIPLVAQVVPQIGLFGGRPEAFQPLVFNSAGFQPASAFAPTPNNPPCHHEERLGSSTHRRSVLNRDEGSAFAFAVFVAPGFRVCVATLFPIFFCAIHDGSILPKLTAWAKVLLG
jgi:hypothetical protein